MLVVRGQKPLIYVQLVKIYIKTKTMCIAILNGKNITLKPDTLRTCWNNNPDGAGMAWVEKGRVKVFKELKSVETFIERYKDVRSTYKGLMLLHFRIATRGLKDVNNCHPFKVNNNLAFIHNGTVSGVKTSKTESDTVMLNKEIFQQLPDNFYKNEELVSFIEKFIGQSKVVLLDSDQNYKILNESSGSWEHSCWFSNKSYIPKPVVAKTDYELAKEHKPTFSLRYQDGILSSTFGDTTFVFTDGKWHGPKMDLYEKLNGVPPFLVTPKLAQDFIDYANLSNLSKLVVPIEQVVLPSTYNNTRSLYSTNVTPQELVGMVVLTYNGLCEVLEVSNEGVYAKALLQPHNKYVTNYYKEDLPKFTKVEKNRHYTISSVSTFEIGKAYVDFPLIEYTEKLRAAYADKKKDRKKSKRTIHVKA